MDEYGYGGGSLLEDDLQGLLDAVDPAGLDYRGWVDVGMALAAEGVPWEVWDAWSARDAARYHAGECERKYRTFRAGGDGRVNGGTLVHMAMEAGYEPPAPDDVALDWDVCEADPWDGPGQPGARDWRTTRPQAAPAAKPAATAKPAVETDDVFLRKLRAGQRVIAVELDSPKDADLTAYLEGARRLQAAGADLLTIADCPIARARMDSSLVACRVHRELGMNVLPHMTCRDRNLNATKALLLGLYAEGVREVLAITGDPIPTAERDEVKNVYQFNSRKLAQYIVSLAGEGREMPSPITVFGALNLNARNFEVELRRAAEKLENGMSGFLTQPLLSAQAVENLKKTRETLGERAKILAGILPVVSQRNAIFMENEVNGIHVDEAIIQKFEGLDRTAGEELGLEVSVQAAKAAAPYADGFYLMTPFNRVALMERLIARLRTEVTD